ncbi:hypothetical protein Pint_34830 [Pistacia integerrima]|uniref:Uncharacterized protein n=1 Tax=Pistacia integerrima TaxID=434235 RepID=A0ACC0X9N4_9ROSI|nr:hypothetical protein Pint_34830 [Pistacia integerrima]
MLGQALLLIAIQMTLTDLIVSRRDLKFMKMNLVFHCFMLMVPVLSANFITLVLLFQVCKLSTGDSLDMSPQDEATIIANDATVKDMEVTSKICCILHHGAAVGYVADLWKVPAIFVKAVTDIVDGEKPTAEEFMQNLAAVTAALDTAVTQVVDFINGKRLAEL